MTTCDKTKVLGAGDVVNRVMEHELSESGMTFVEALALVLATTSPISSATSCSASRAIRFTQTTSEL